MEKFEQEHKGHVLVLVSPAQGHLNPLLQFAKRLASKGLRATIATTHYTVKSIDAPGITVEPISDGFDDGGFVRAPSAEAYIERFKEEGSRTLAELIQKHEGSGHPVICVVYDSFLPWALDVAKRFGIYGASFFTTSAAVCYIYYRVHHGLMTLPPKLEPTPAAVPGWPPMGFSNLPSFLASPESYPAYLAAVKNQFSNLEMADWILGNTFLELESEVMKVMSTLHPTMLPIGPMVPSTYLDGRMIGDTEYGANLCKPVGNECMKWLETKPSKSVVYVSFGSIIQLTAKQMEELAMGLKESGKHFLWVLKESESCKLPDKFIDSTQDSGLVVTWCVQPAVLAHQAMGCFITHCGWNSTLEGLSMGVPMVGLPQWTDQPTNATFVEEVWKVGVRAMADESGIVRREDLQKCIREVMEGDRSKEINWNANKWRELAKVAIGEGGSSDKNIDEFVRHLLHAKC